MELAYYLICLVLLIPAGFATAYYLFLAAVAVLFCRKPAVRGGDKTTRFAILIPAHNEEQCLETTLKSCAALDYSKDKVDVFVIADNCHDQTASIAVQAGVTCLERFNEIDRGKGFALKWAFDQILPQGHDVYLIVDADCLIESQALLSFDYYFQQGYQAVQCNYQASNPDDNSQSYAVALANFMENQLFCAAKSRLGFSVFLRGTGMAFQRSILEEIPWKADSAVEDLEYSLELVHRGVKVAFATEVAVLSPFPVDKNELDVQRKRWIGGGVAFSKLNSLKLMWEGLKSFQPSVFDAGWTLVAQSRSLILLDTLLAAGAAAVAYWAFPGQVSEALCVASASIIAGQVLYLLLGVLMMGLNLKRLLFLMAFPLTIFRFLTIAVYALFKSKTAKSSWNRTPRTASHS